MRGPRPVCRRFSALGRTGYASGADPRTASCRPRRTNGHKARYGRIVARRCRDLAGSVGGADSKGSRCRRVAVKVAPRGGAWWAKWRVAAEAIDRWPRATLATLPSVDTLAVPAGGGRGEFAPDRRAWTGAAEAISPGFKQSNERRC